MKRSKLDAADAAETYCSRNVSRSFLHSSSSERNLDTIVISFRIRSPNSSIPLDDGIFFSSHERHTHKKMPVRKKSRKSSKRKYRAVPGTAAGGRYTVDQHAGAVATMPDHISKARATLLTSLAARLDLMGNELHEVQTKIQELLELPPP